MSNLPCGDFNQNYDGSLKDTTLITLFDFGFYSHMLSMISGVISLTVALILYRKASYDKI
jgi:hypothetical protein